MGDTIISWTKKTWNPVTGCSRVSAGCERCYAERLSLRYGWSHKPWTAQNAAENIVWHPGRLDEPRRWRNATRVFVCSMSDFFHPVVLAEWQGRILDVMRETPHTYQILTKRPEGAASYLTTRTLPDNAWLGVSVEHDKTFGRIDTLRSIQATRRFISFEPLIGPVESLTAEALIGIDWVIVGGESGEGYRPLDHAWARHIRDRAVAAGAAFFFKQDAAYKTETRPWLVEPDGSRWQWEQYPGQHIAPVCLDDASRAWPEIRGNA